MINAHRIAYTENLQETEIETETDMDIQNLLKRIDENKSLMDEHRPLAPEELKELDNFYRIGLTYTSNALEGNTLTLSETKIAQRGTNPSDELFFKLICECEIESQKDFARMFRIKLT